jgi:hypothetical protein
MPGQATWEERREAASPKRLFSNNRDDERLLEVPVKMEIRIRSQGLALAYGHEEGVMKMSLRSSNEGRYQENSDCMRYDVLKDVNSNSVMLRADSE